MLGQRAYTVYARIFLKDKSPKLGLFNAYKFACKAWVQLLSSLIFHYILFI